jgi:hypothetical protein
MHGLVCIITRAVNCCLLTAESWFQSQVGPCGIYGTWVDFVIIKRETVTLFLCVFMCFIY